ncbi:hypothetical protein K439DRAFT_1612899 [Ramaria rubella]|nr:hypothetical protein K439DRAFT_1612899 [Ramaria rubella]
MSISSTNPGPCLNSDCSAKPCGVFVPVDDDPLIALLCKRCACGCLGVQHYKKSNAGNELLDSAAPKPSTPAKTADFAFTLPPSGAYERLKACAKDRKAQVNATRVDGMNPGYDPAAKVIFMTSHCFIFIFRYTYVYMCDREVYQKAFEQLQGKASG